MAIVRLGGRRTGQPSDLRPHRRDVGRHQTAGRCRRAVDRVGRVGETVTHDSETTEVSTVPGAARPVIAWISSPPTYWSARRALVHRWRGWSQKPGRVQRPQVPRASTRPQASWAWRWPSRHDSADDEVLRLGNRPNLRPVTTWPSSRAYAWMRVRRCRSLRSGQPHGSRRDLRGEGPGHDDDARVTQGVGAQSRRVD